MGFGILFIGYFLVLNFAYCAFTDALAGAVMLYGLYKLSGINRGFNLAYYISMAFTALGLVELSVAAYDMFIPLSDTSLLLSLPALLRHAVLGALCVSMLIGIAEVADEVGLRELSKRAKRNLILTAAVYCLNIMLEIPALSAVIAPAVLMALYFASIIATLAVTAMNLIAVYSCYMRICMPQEKEMPEKKSKFAFVNSLKQHEEAKSREYAEYKLQRFKDKQQKQQKQKKRKKK